MESFVSLFQKEVRGGVHACKTHTVSQITSTVRGEGGGAVSDWWTVVESANLCLGSGERRSKLQL